MLKKIQNVTIYLAIMGLFAYCATNPVTGKKQIVLMTEEQEIAMGKQYDPEIIAEYGLYADSNLQRYINQKGQEMVRVSHRPNIPYHFRVLDSDVINAFALPGGYVYFTRGILAHMNDEAQFAGVLGHEIGHVTARHSVSQQTKTTFAQLGLIAAMVSSKYVAQFAQEASAGVKLLLLSFSREAESQSDELGVAYSSKIGYDAHEMAKFFETLKRQAVKEGAELPEFLSTHPDPGNRFQRVNQLATQFQNSNNLRNLKINRNEFLKLVNGIVYGPDPREGFIENHVFYHPVLKFQFSTPRGWKYQNSPRQVIFANADGSASMFLTTTTGNSPEQAAQTFVQKANLQLLDQRSLSINGHRAFSVVADQLQQTPTGQIGAAVRAMAYFIQFNNTMYAFVGASSPQAFGNFQSAFQQYFASFRTLTDPSKINVKPERIKLNTVSKPMTLQQALTQFGVPAARLEEIALLNGMFLNSNLTGGTLVKTLERK